MRCGDCKHWYKPVEKADDNCKRRLCLALSSIDHVQGYNRREESGYGSESRQCVFTGEGFGCAKFDRGDK
jgi:hypothetical protein